MFFRFSFKEFLPLARRDKPLRPPSPATGSHRSSHLERATSSPGSGYLRALTSDFRPPTSDLWSTLSPLGTSPVVPWSCSLVVLSLPPSVPSVKSVVKRFRGFFTLGGKKLCIAAKIERPEDRGTHEIRERVPFFRVFCVFRG